MNNGVLKILFALLLAMVFAGSANAEGYGGRGGYGGYTGIDSGANADAGALAVVEGAQNYYAAPRTPAYAPDAIPAPQTAKCLASWSTAGGVSGPWANLFGVSAGASGWKYSVPCLYGEVARIAINSHNEKLAAYALRQQLMVTEQIAQRNGYDTPALDDENAKTAAKEDEITASKVSMKADSDATKIKYRDWDTQHNPFWFNN